MSEVMICAPAIQNRAVAINATLILGRVSINEYIQCILIQNLARFAELWEHSDTTPTIENLSLLFGSVRNAIGEYTAARDTARAAPEYVPMKYQCKASSRERNAGV